MIITVDITDGEEFQRENCEKVKKSDFFIEEKRKEKENCLQEKLKASPKIVEKLIEILSEFANNAYETIKIIAPDKKKVVITRIKEIMTGIENFTQSFCMKHNYLLNDNENLTFFELYENLEDTIIKLLESHGKLFKVHNN